MGPVGPEPTTYGLWAAVLVVNVRYPPDLVRADSRGLRPLPTELEGRLHRALTCGNAWWAPSGSNRRPTD